jgi:hypothetical protein
MADDALRLGGELTTLQPNSVNRRIQTMCVYADFRESLAAMASINLDWAQ